MFKRIVLCGVVVALTSAQSHAGCGLFSKLFGGRCSQSSYTVRGCQSCQTASAPVEVVPVEYTEKRIYPESLPSSCPDGKCPNQQYVPQRRFSLFR